jgi:hypothetical protein
LQKRGNQKVNAVTQFLLLADGISKTGDCTLLLLGATNKPWAIDPAAGGRSGPTAARICGARTNGIQSDCAADSWETERIPFYVWASRFSHGETTPLRAAVSTSNW